ncbi:MAG: LacI family DNA-binding transcriptional regulator [Acidobacteria bacterium]|nr:LacI family DNA-binding transcriptional regulator [Acidobacteriota bacterium]
MRMVAEKAGVSTATVSRVISGSPLVRPETAAIVRRVIDELQFIPNASATTLKYGRSDMFGIIVSNVINPFFLEFLRDFEGYLTEKQQGILLANIEDPERAEGAVRRMLRHQVDGVVVIPSHEEFHDPYQRFVQRRIPVVTFDRRVVRPLVSDVSYRFDHGMQQAVGHLHALGHRRIALIGGYETSTSSRLRAEAFIHAMQEYRLEVRPEWMICGDYKVDGGEAAMRKFMHLPQRPTAVISVNDMMALGALRAAHAMGLAVPADVSLIGFDDILLSEIVSPSLTTLHVSRSAVAKGCIEAFTRMSEHPEEPGLQLMIDASLIVRDSTTAPPA